jgi:hypothetical protein
VAEWSVSVAPELGRKPQSRSREIKLQKSDESMTKNLFTPPRLIASGLVLGSALTAHSALACGGFFCSRSAPVFQAAERIIFAQEGERVTQIVEVMYEGPSENFSWVLPVPGIPVPDVSSTQVFDRLDSATAPQYMFEGDSGCLFPPSPEFDGIAVDNAGPPTSPVTVLDSGSVGPFDYETISINVQDDPEIVAVKWLTDNGYDVTDETGAILGPYLANGLNLIAFRLQKGQSTGAIRPISLEYDAPKMAIPIKPTSVAANENMPVLVWVLGEHRAVPTNYRGLEINELLIDWFDPASSYQAVVTAAANEAGGQGFVTELVTDAAGFADQVRPTDSDLAGVFPTEGTLEERLVQITSQLGSWDGFLESASAYLELRAGVTLEEFIGCSNCYFHPENYGVDGATELGFGGAGAIEEGAREDDPIFNTDMAAFEQSLRDTVIKPLNDVGALLETHRKITRLFTTMSAEEMTLDPTFEFNPDLEDVSNVHTALIEMDNLNDCSDERWTVTLEDGTQVVGEGLDWPHRLGDTTLPANTRILQFSTSGAAEEVGALISPPVDTATGGQSSNPPAASGGATGSDAPAAENKEDKAGCAFSPAPQGSPLSWLASLSVFGFLYTRRRHVRLARCAE